MDSSSPRSGRPGNILCAQTTQVTRELPGCNQLPPRLAAPHQLERTTQLCPLANLAPVHE